MKAQFLKAGGALNEEHFYKMYPTEEHFFQAHPHMRQMQKGGKTTLGTYGAAAAKAVPGMFDIMSNVLPINTLVKTASGESDYNMNNFVGNWGKDIQNSWNRYGVTDEEAQQGSTPLGFANNMASVALDFMPYDQIGKSIFKGGQKILKEGIPKIKMGPYTDEQRAAWYAESLARQKYINELTAKNKAFEDALRARVKASTPKVIPLREPIKMNPGVELNPGVPLNNAIPFNGGIGLNSELQKSNFFTNFKNYLKATKRPGEKSSWISNGMDGNRRIYTGSDKYGGDIYEYGGSSAPTAAQFFKEGFAPNVDYFKTGGENFDGQTQEGFLDLRKQGLMKFIQSKTMNAIQNEEAQSIDQQMQSPQMQNGGIPPDYGYKSADTQMAMYDNAIAKFSNPNAMNNLGMATSDLMGTAQEYNKFNVTQTPGYNQARYGGLPTFQTAGGPQIGADGKIINPNTTHANSGQGMASDGNPIMSDQRSKEIANETPEEKMRKRADFEKFFGEMMRNYASQDQGDGQGMGYGTMPKGYNYGYGNQYFPMNQRRQDTWSGDLSGMKNMDWKNTQLASIKNEEMGPIKRFTHMFAKDSKTGKRNWHLGSEKEFEMTFRTRRNPVTGEIEKTPVQQQSESNSNVPLNQRPNANQQIYDQMDPMKIMGIDPNKQVTPGTQTQNAPTGQTMDWKKQAMMNPMLNKFINSPTVNTTPGSQLNFQTPGANNLYQTNASATEDYGHNLSPDTQTQSNIIMTPQQEAMLKYGTGLPSRFNKYGGSLPKAQSGMAGIFQQQQYDPFNLKGSGFDNPNNTRNQKLYDPEMEGPIQKLDPRKATSVNSGINDPHDIPDYTDTTIRKETNTSYDPEALVNWGMAGVEGLTNFFNRDERKSAEHNQFAMTTADKRFKTFPSGNKGNYGVNDGLFRVDQHTGVENTGFGVPQYGTAKYGGDAQYNLEDEVEMTPAEIKAFLKAGGRIEFVK